jgi:hypothetical protein
MQSAFTNYKPIVKIWMSYIHATQVLIDVSIISILLRYVCVDMCLYVHVNMSVLVYVNFYVYVFINANFFNEHNFFWKFS